MTSATLRFSELIQRSCNQLLLESNETVHTALTYQPATSRRRRTTIHDTSGTLKPKESLKCVSKTSFDDMAAACCLFMACESRQPGFMPETAELLVLLHLRPASVMRANYSKIAKSFHDTIPAKPSTIRACHALFSRSPSPQKRLDSSPKKPKNPTIWISYRYPSIERNMHGRPSVPNR